MREALAFILFLAVVALGWKKPYSTQYYSLVGKSRPAKTETRAVAAPLSPAERLAQIEAKYGAPAASTAAPAKDRNWMFEKTKMDAGYKADGR